MGLVKQTEFVIEDGVPIPAKTTRLGSTRATYPWAKMKKKGQSFFVAIERSKTKRLTSSLGSGGRAFKLKCVTRTVREKGKWGVRIWRVA